MEKGLLQDRIDSNEPFVIETASGRRFEIPGSDYIHLTPSRTAAVVFWTAADGDHMAVVPLLTITSVESRLS